MTTNTCDFASIDASALNHVTGGGPGAIAKTAKTVWNGAKTAWKGLEKGSEIVNAGQSVIDAGKSVYNWAKGGEEKK